MPKHKGCRKHQWTLSRATGNQSWYGSIRVYARRVIVRCIKCGEKDSYTQIRWAGEMFKPLAPEIDIERAVRKANYTLGGKRKK